MVNVVIFPINLTDNRHLKTVIYQQVPGFLEVEVTSFLECEFICCELQFSIEVHICHTNILEIYA